LAIDHFVWLSHKHGTVFLPTSLHQLLYRLSRDNLKHFYLPNLTHHFKLLSHIFVPCPRSYLAYATLISTFYYYYYYYYLALTPFPYPFPRSVYHPTRPELGSLAKSWGLSPLTLSPGERDPLPRAPRPALEPLCDTRRLFVIFTSCDSANGEIL